MSSNIKTDLSTSNVLRRKGGKKVKQTAWQTLENAAQRQPGVNSAIAESRALLTDEDLKFLVYKKSIQACIYPISSVDPHKLIVWNAKKPTYCFECGGLLWGIARQGLKCIECGISCHSKCQDLLNADCLQKAASKSSKHGSKDKTNTIILAMKERMERLEREKVQTFELIRNVFTIPPNQHQKHMTTVKENVLGGTAKWSAKISITVISASSLEAKDKGGTSDPYVTVEVAKTKKRTKTIFNTLDPVWNETFQFECHNSSARIKIRVWDEDDDMKSRIKQQLLRESDDFLGQALVDVNTLSGNMNVWYNLDKRTDKSVVSGRIHVKMIVEIKGEESFAPYHRQYTCLHENLFHHLMESGNNQLLKAEKFNDRNRRLYFSGVAQELLSEFSMRYAIEPIYMTMTHFSCLAAAYHTPGARAIMVALLRDITKGFDQDSQAASKSALFEASNFGKEKFIRLLENLQTSLRIDLTMYRVNFPNDQAEKLVELKSCLQLIRAIVHFKVKILDGRDESNDIIGKCCKLCTESTYSHVFTNCMELYDEEYDSEVENQRSKVTDMTSQLDSLEFWTNLVTLLATVVEEDKSVYESIFNECTEINILEVCINALWDRFTDDMCKMLKEQCVDDTNKTSDFMNLQFKIKWFYKEYVVQFLTNQDTAAEFYSWFEPFTLLWLQDNEKDSDDIMRAAFASDKKHGFQKISDHALFSSSVVDIFTKLSQSFNIITKLECKEKDINDRYIDMFSKNIELVLTEYIKLVHEVFPEYSDDTQVSCVLLNNIQQARIQLEKLYNMMGGVNLSENITRRLNDVQIRLNSQIDVLCEEYAVACQKSIGLCCQKLGELLRAIKGSSNAPTQSNSKTLAKESDTVIKPVMDALDARFGVFAQSSEKSILKRVLKHMWKLVITTLEVTVVLPKDPSLDMSKCVLTPRHCAVLENALHSLKDLFHASGNGLKLKLLEKTEELHKLMYALSLYTQATDSLIKHLVHSQTSQDFMDGKEGNGEVNIQADIFTHPGTGEHKITMKVIAADKLNWKCSSMFRPFVEVVIIGPHLSERKRSFETKSRSNTLSPKYNESFTFVLNSEADLSSYEIQLCMKDYCFARDDLVIGVGVLQLKDVMKQGSYSTWCPLVSQLFFDQIGHTVLRILSQRSTDNAASELVKVKRMCRSAQDEK